MIFTQDNICDFNKVSQSKFDENFSFLMRLKTKKSKKVDDAFLDLHDDVFIETDCLQCANCCKTTSPVFTETDIRRIAKFLKMRPTVLIDTYLHLDDENDYVLNNAPCTFLAADNYCTIYDVRPRACREYPHTNRKNMVGILKLTAMNTIVCPAVFEIVERLKKLEKGFHEKNK